MLINKIEWNGKVKKYDYELIANLLLTYGSDINTSMQGREYFWNDIGNFIL